VLERRRAILSLLEDTNARLQAEGLLAGDDDAFIAGHPGLGYAHNFDAWKLAHKTLLSGREV
jgi:hypothetical protein